MVQGIQEAQASTLFPQEIEVVLTLRIKVSTQEDRDCYLTHMTNTVSPQLLADGFDGFMPYDSEELVSINGLTYDQLRSVLQPTA